VARPALAVELAIGDPELSERVRDALGQRFGYVIVTTDADRSAEVLIADAVDQATDALPVLVLVTHAAEAAEALRLGATAVLSADAGAGVLRAAVRAAAAGLTTLPADLRSDLIGPPGRSENDGEADAAPAGLTAREMQVLQLLAAGASNKAIARRLGITPHTAKFHVAAIAAKLGASGRTDAVAKAMRLGLVMV
jgi:DNA-binding NarL/FixJ family response regulator